jgi:N6-adenosine-specific RNA methylase IME4
VICLTEDFWENTKNNKFYNEKPIDFRMEKPTPTRYGTIYADPPWMERGGGKIKRGADRHYSLMKTKDIAALPVKELAADNAHLYLWVTNNFLKDGLEVMEAWGFRYVTMVTWAKDRIGLGQYFRGQTEHILFGVRGKVPYKVDENGKRQQGRTLMNASRMEHSRKPEEFREMIEKVSYGPFLELFARRPAEGWHTWGNQVESDVTMNLNQED